MKKLIKYRPTGHVEIKFQPSPQAPQVLRVIRKSDLTGKDNTMDLPVTEEQLRNWIGNNEHPGQLILDAMPHLSAEQREFLISGCSPEEWQEQVVEKKEES